MDPEAPTVVEPLLPNATGANGQLSVQQPKWKAVWAAKAYGFLSHIAMCLLFGLLTAFCLKSISRTIAIVVIIVFVLVQVLAYYGFISWTQLGGMLASSVKSSVVRQMDVNSDGQVNLADCKLCLVKTYKTVLGYGVPSLGGFALGFYLGWRVF